MIVWRIVSRTRLVVGAHPNLTLSCRKCHSKSDGGSEKGGKEYPEEPTTCCMSGCANCVWIEYAQKLSEFYKDGGDEAVRQINEKVTDPNMKAFLMHELRMKNVTRK
ncbi:oxidoreductase-like domain-containing protein 1 [Zophobas morio]|uniref:oxidoreductase-like domain-containing protein 1 n=1 Tax=Zophobas morio TaxID=2755281 RepID=UPI0030833680